MSTPETPARPAVQPPGPWSFPRADESTLRNGLRVLHHHLPGQHVASLALHLPAPLTAEPAGAEGTAALLTATLGEGTRTLPGPAHGEAVEACGAALEAAAGYSHTHVLVDVPATRLAEAAALVTQAVAEPELRDADVERERAVHLAHTAQRLATGAGRATHALRRALVDPRHRASRMSSGEPDDVTRVTGAHVRALHAATFGPRGATLVLAGDLPSAQVDAALAAIEAWDAPTQGPWHHERPTSRAPRAWLVDRPGSVQADLRLGWFTIDRADPRWAALQIAANALGGAHLSRLNRVLREEKGFTYGASLVNAPLRHGGYTYAQGSFRTEVVGDALALMPGLLDTTASPLTDAEVVRARDYLVGTSPQRYATAAGVAGGVLGLLAAGLPTTFVDDQIEAWRHVTAEQASAVASDLLDPDARALVVVGDANALAPVLAAGGWDAEVLPPDTSP